MSLYAQLYSNRMQRKKNVIVAATACVYVYGRDIHCVNKYIRTVRSSQYSIIPIHQSNHHTISLLTLNVGFTSARVYLFIQCILHINTQHTHKRTHTEAR